MKLYILGCGDAFGSGGRNQSAYLFDVVERIFRLGCGLTTLDRAKGHFPDLIVGFLFLTVATRRRRTTRTKTRIPSSPYTPIDFTHGCLGGVWVFA